jgi:hypothetical protein
MFELADGGKVALENVVVDGGEVFFVHLELVGPGGNELSGGERMCEIGDEKCHKSDVKRKEGFNTMSHVKGRVAGRPADGGTVSPKDMRSAGRPLGDIAFTSLDKRVANGPVLLLNDAIGARVVS